MYENSWSRSFEKNINSVINFRRVIHFRLCLLETQVACDALFNAEVNPKLFRCWYQLNKSTEIEVRTGAGDSVWGLAGPFTGQGGGGAAMASALNLDRGVERYFCDSTDEDCYGTIRLQPLIYIDDLARSSTDLNSVRNGNMKFSSLAMEKQLQFHPTKSSF